MSVYALSNPIENDADRAVVTKLFPPEYLITRDGVPIGTAVNKMYADAIVANLSRDQRIGHYQTHGNLKFTTISFMTSNNGETVDTLLLVSTLDDKPANITKWKAAEIFPREHCMHEYDCCGRFYQMHNPTVTALPNGYRVIMLTHSLNV